MDSEKIIIDCYVDAILPQNTNGDIAIGMHFQSDNETIFKYSILYPSKPEYTYVVAKFKGLYVVLYNLLCYNFADDVDLINIYTNYEFAVNVFNSKSKANKWKSYYESYLEANDKLDCIRDIVKFHYISNNEENPNIIKATNIANKQLSMKDPDDYSNMYFKYSRYTYE